MGGAAPVRCWQAPNIIHKCCRLISTHTIASRHQEDRLYRKNFFLHYSCTFSDVFLIEDKYKKWRSKMEHFINRIDVYPVFLFKIMKKHHFGSGSTSFKHIVSSNAWSPLWTPWDQLHHTSASFHGQSDTIHVPVSTDCAIVFHTLACWDAIFKTRLRNDEAVCLCEVLQTLNQHLWFYIPVSARSAWKMSVSNGLK